MNLICITTSRKFSTFCSIYRLSFREFKLGIQILIVLGIGHDLEQNRMLESIGWFLIFQGLDTFRVNCSSVVRCSQDLACD